MPIIKVSLLNLVFILFFNTQAMTAPPTCLEMKELNKLTDKEKENFPPSFMKLPFFLTIDVHFGYGAAIKVLKVIDDSTGEEHLKAISNVKAPNLDYQTDSYIKKVCKAGKKFELVLENGRHIQTEEDGGQISVEGHRFKKGNAEDFIRVSSAIDEKRGSQLKTVETPGRSSVMGIK